MEAGKQKNRIDPAKRKEKWGSLRKPQVEDVARGELLSWGQVRAYGGIKRVPRGDSSS